LSGEKGCWQVLEKDKEVDEKKVGVWHEKENWSLATGGGNHRGAEGVGEEKALNQKGERTYHQRGVSFLCRRWFSDVSGGIEKKSRG